MATDIRTKIKSLLGGHGAQRKLANATGLSDEHVSRIMRGEYEAPEYLVALVEFLEAVPQKDWPKRWRGDL